MGKVTARGIVTFVAWPVVAPTILLMVAAFLLIAWPLTLIADFDRASEP